MKINKYVLKILIRENIIRMIDEASNVFPRYTPDGVFITAKGREMPTRIVSYALWQYFKARILPNNPELQELYNADKKINGDKPSFRSNTGNKTFMNWCHDPQNKDFIKSFADNLLKRMEAKPLVNGTNSVLKKRIDNLKTSNQYRNWANVELDNGESDEDESYEGESEEEKAERIEKKRDDAFASFLAQIGNAYNEYKVNIDDSDLVKGFMKWAKDNEDEDGTPPIFTNQIIITNGMEERYVQCIDAIQNNIIANGNNKNRPLTSYEWWHKLDNLIAKRGYNTDDLSNEYGRVVNLSSLKEELVDNVKDSKSECVKNGDIYLNPRGHVIVLVIDKDGSRFVDKGRVDPRNSDIIEVKQMLDHWNNLLGASSGAKVQQGNGKIAVEIDEITYILSDNVGRGKIRDADREGNLEGVLNNPVFQGEEQGDDDDFDDDDTGEKMGVKTDNRKRINANDDAELERAIRRSMI